MGDTQDIQDALNSLEISVIRHGNTGMIGDSFSIKTVKQAIKALNKQKSVKGITEWYETTNGGLLGEAVRCICPICNEHIVAANYCENCGQRLYWV